MDKINPNKTQKRYYSNEDKISYWKKWQCSSLTKKAFAVKNKLPNSFYDWGKLLQADKLSSEKGGAKLRKSKIKKPALLPVTPTNEIQSSQNSNFRCLYSSNGINLELNMPISTLVNFILELNNATAIIR